MYFFVDQNLGELSGCYDDISEEVACNNDCDCDAFGNSQVCVNAICQPFQEGVDKANR